MLGQVGRLVGVTLRPGGLRACLTWRPFSITSFHMLRALRRYVPELGSVVDGGANIGQFARAAAMAYPGARVVSFEPLPDIADRLRRNLADCPRVTVRECALGSRSGRVSIHRNRYSLASSILPMDSVAGAQFGNLEELEDVEVAISSLDEELQNETLDRPLLLKLDLQGFELEALKGARAFLDETDYVLLEAALKPMYLGEPLFDEVRGYLEAAGFRYLAPVDRLKGAGGDVVQIDALFASTRGDA